VNYVDGCDIFSVDCDLGFVVSPEEGSSFLPKCSVLFWVFLWWWEKFL